jgi:hypothetical protein
VERFTEEAVVRRASQPIKLFLDLFVYAPVGFLVEAPRLVPELVETGRQRLEAAAGLGRLAVHVGSHRLTGRGSSPSAAPRPPVAPPERTASPAAVVGPETDLPIAGYDQLAASQVVARLQDLDADDLAAVERYELAHRGRRTVLSKVAQLRRG